MTDNLSGTSTVAGTVYSGTHQGWKGVRAVGAKTPAVAAPDLASASTQITLEWNAITLPSGTVDSYNLYRSTSAGSETYASPIATGISASARSYTDTTAVGGTTYYYNLAAVSSGVVHVPDSTADREIKVIAPPANMTLIHRWMANLQMCTELGLASDRANEYRCAFTGIGGNGTYFDVGHSTLMDTYEMGCAYATAAGNCGSANGCVGAVHNPNNVVTPNATGDAYYSRAPGLCWISTNGAVNGWTDFASASTALMVAASSNAPGLPPLGISQTAADAVCKGKTVPGFAGTKRLMTRKEFVIAAAWSETLSDAQIDALETGLNLDANHGCDSSYADPQGATATDISGTHPTIAYDDSDYPAATNRDTLPACLTVDCAGGAANDNRAVRTGSDATSGCVSKFGVQDLVGNVSEFNSDQIGVVTTYSEGITSAFDAVADLVGVVFDDLFFPTYQNGNTYASVGTNQIELPHGIVIDDAGFTRPGTVTRTAAQLHNDGMFVNSGEGLRAVRSGGANDWGATAGRYAVHMRTVPTIDDAAYGFRCVIDAD